MEKFKTAWISVETKSSIGKMGRKLGRW